MAHSIVEFGDNHVMMRDADLLAALTRIQEELQSNHNENLEFLTAFLQSDMVHVSGGIDPNFNTHLKSEESREAFFAVIRNIREAEDVDEQVLQNLNKLQTLIS